MVEELNISVPNVAIQSNEQLDSLKFPIEIRTYWPPLLRGLLLISLAIIFIIFFVLYLSESLYLNYSNYFIFGAFILLMSEYIILRRLIIPKFFNYGRIRVFESYVEYYPLSSLGFSTLRQSNHVSMAKFKGISLKTFSSQYGTYHQIILVHPDQGLDIIIKTFSSDKDAESYAKSLSHMIKLDIIAMPAQRRKKHSL